MSAKHEEARVFRDAGGLTPLEYAALQAGMPALQSDLANAGWEYMVTTLKRYSEFKSRPLRYSERISHHSCRHNLF